ncbi:MAG: hypothetical protein AAGA35_03710 [Patescibacteria group bacterium]
MQHHHAVLYCGESLTNVIEKQAIVLTSVDTHVTEVDRLDIATVRTIIQQAHVRPLQDTVQILLISAQTIAPEAQQALLKVLEEPPVTTNFVLLLPTTKGLLPTVLSRLAVVETRKSHASESFLVFTKLSVGERLAEIATRVKAKDQEWIEAVYEGFLSTADSSQTQTALFVDLQKDFRGASKKMLLEEIALSL